MIAKGKRTLCRGYDAGSRIFAWYISANVARTAGRACLFDVPDVELDPFRFYVV